MSTQNQADDRANEKSEDRVEEKDMGEMLMPLPTEEELQATARARRLAVLRAAQGLWKDRTDIPNDGVEAQEQLRAEWH